LRDAAVLQLLFDAHALEREPATAPLPRHDLVRQLELQPLEPGEARLERLLVLLPARVPVARQLEGVRERVLGIPRADPAGVEALHAESGRFVSPPRRWVRTAKRGGQRDCLGPAPSGGEVGPSPDFSTRAGAPRAGSPAPVTA